MSDENLIEEEQLQGLPPLPEIAETLEEEAPLEPPRRRGRPPKGGGGGGGLPRQAQQQPGQPRIDDLDEYMASLDWNMPGMKARVKRLAPQFWQGQSIAGHLEERDSEGYSTEELKASYGGGTYLVEVFGAPDGGRIQKIGARKVSISGAPLIESNRPETLPQEARFARPGFIPGEGGVGVTRGLVGVIADEQKELRRAALDAPRVAESVINQVQESHQTALSAVQRASEERARAREDAANALIADAQARLERSEDERIKLTNELREKEKDFMNSVDKLRSEMATQVSGASGDTLKLLTAFFPAMSAQKAEESQALMKEYAAKEERLNAQHQMALQNMQNMHQQSLEGERQRSALHIKQMESAHENVVAVLKLQLQGKENEVAHLQRQVEDLRRATEDAQKKLVDYVTMSKDTSSKLTEVVALMETMNSLKEAVGGGGGGGGGEPEDGIENPLMRSVLGIANKVATNLPAITEAYAASKAQQMPPQVMMMPPGYGMPPQMPPMQMPQMPQAMVPLQQPPPVVKPKAKPKSKIKKEDLAQACMIMDAVLMQPEPTAPAEFAKMATSSVDNAVLRELAARTPAKVIEQLEAAGLLTAKLASPEGKAWIEAVLLALRESLLPKQEG